MRFTVRTMLGVLLISCCSDVSATESNSRFWSFGRSETPTTRTTADPATLATQQAQTPTMQQGPSLPITPIEPDSETEQKWMLKSPWAKISWPRLNMPSFGSDESDATAPRNTWVEPDLKPAEPSPLSAVKRGARRVGDTTKSAWHSTVDALTPGDDTHSSRSSIAQRKTRPSFWKRMFFEESASKQPETIPEWMAQDRLNP